MTIHEIKKDTILEEDMYKPSYIVSLVVFEVAYHQNIDNKIMDRFYSIATHMDTSGVVTFEKFNFREVFDNDEQYDDFMDKVNSMGILVAFDHGDSNYTTFFFGPAFIKNAFNTYNSGDITKEEDEKVMQYMKDAIESNMIPIVTSKAMNTPEAKRVQEITGRAKDAVKALWRTRGDFDAAWDILHPDEEFIAGIDMSKN